MNLWVRTADMSELDLKFTWLYEYDPQKFMNFMNQYGTETE